MEAVGVRVDIPINHIGSENMTGVRIRIAKEVGKRYGGEGVIVSEFILEELHFVDEDGNTSGGKRRVD